MHFDSQYQSLGGVTSCDVIYLRRKRGRVKIHERLFDVAFVLLIATETMGIIGPREYGVFCHAKMTRGHLSIQLKCQKKLAEKDCMKPMKSQL